MRPKIPRPRPLTGAFTAVIHFGLMVALIFPSWAQEWALRNPQGTVKVVDLGWPFISVKLNYAEPLVSLDKDNQWIPCLAEDWRWLNEKTIEFRLRRGVTFHNGEDFDAEAVRVNWEAYRNMANPIGMRLEAIPDDTAFETVGKYFVRFTFPEPDGLAFVRFAWFLQFAPGFFAEHERGRP